MNKHGSVILVVLIILIALSVVALATLRNTSFFVDEVYMRERYERQYRLTEGLMYYGIVIAQTYFNTIQQKQQKSVSRLDHWPSAHSPYTGTLLFVPKKQEITVSALLKNGSTKCSTIRCSLRKVGQTFKIVNWKIGA